VLLFGMTLFTALWSESFDRLWEVVLLRDIRFPRLAGTVADAEAADDTPTGG
jgi:hypothetical protein